MRQSAYGEVIPSCATLVVDEAHQLLLVRGAVPGSKNGHVVVSPAVKVKVKKGAN